MTNRDSSLRQPVSDCVIRSESDGDAREIRRVIVAAFGSEMEADLVEALRNHGASIISLVACAEGEIVGHVAFSPMHADGQPDRADVLGLAPVAVHPRWQRQGIGSALVRRGLDECRRRAVATVFVLGDPDFYARFGFIPAHTRGLRCVYEAPRCISNALAQRYVRAAIDRTDSLPTRIRFLRMNLRSSARSWSAPALWRFPVLRGVLKAAEGCRTPRRCRIRSRVGLVCGSQCAPEF